MSRSTLIFPSNVSERKATTIPKEKFTYKLLKGDSFVASACVVDSKKQFEWVSVLIRDLLIPAEIIDVDRSWMEIREGRAKKFTNVKDFLNELKR